MAPALVQDDANGSRPSVDELVDQVNKASDTFAIGCSPFLTFIYDSSKYKNVLSNPQNFTKETRCNILHAQNDKAKWLNDLGDQAMLKYIKDSESDQEPVFRILFCTIESNINATWNCQLSLSSQVSLALMRAFNISPHNFCLLVGEFDYYAPGDFASYDENGALRCIEFFVQQPQWDLYVEDKDISWNVYMSHNPILQQTTYIVAHAKLQKSRGMVIDRLAETFGQGENYFKVHNKPLPDPFTPHIIIMHESFVEGDQHVADIRNKLDDALVGVENYTKQPASERPRGDLEKWTLQLNAVSRLIDSMSVNVNMAGSFTRRLAEAHRRYAQSVHQARMKDPLITATDSIRYLANSIELGQEWLKNFKASQETAMNLVFNLVTQQDAATSTTIAREAKADGTSMKVIAALTMVFLPGTFLSSVFGMESLGNTHWWLYVSLTLPLTILIVTIWWVWMHYPIATPKWYQIGSWTRARRQRQRQKQEKIEAPC